MLLCSKQMAKDVAHKLTLVLARSGNPRHDVGPSSTGILYNLYIYIYKITSRQNDIELGTCRNEASFWSQKKGQSPSHVNPVGTPPLFERTYSVSAGPKCVTRLAWQHCSHWTFTWQQPIRTNNHWALMRWMKKTSDPHRINISGTTMAEFPKQLLDKGRCLKKSITNDFKFIYAKLCKNMQLLCGWWYIMNAKCGLWCIHTQ